MRARIVLSLAAVGVVLGLTVAAHANAPAGLYTTANGTVHDSKTNLTWQQEAPSTTYVWADATTYCSGLSLVGGGWRLPTVKELLTIVDWSRSNPSIDPNAFPSAPAYSFWSSSRSASSSSRAWYVEFYAGQVSEFEVSTTCAVRCVR